MQHNRNTLSSLFWPPVTLHVRTSYTACTAIYKIIPQPECRADVFQCFISMMGWHAWFSTDYHPTTFNFFAIPNTKFIKSQFHKFTASFISWSESGTRKIDRQTEMCGSGFLRKGPVKLYAQWLASSKERPKHFFVQIFIPMTTTDFLTCFCSHLDLRQAKYCRT